MTMLLTTTFTFCTNRIKLFNLLLLFFLLIGLIQSSHAQSKEDALKSFFSAIDKNGDINGSVLVMEKGKVLFQKSYGYADVQNRIPNTENTLFQLASVSKIFTAIAILQLNEKKKLRLTDKVAMYFPKFPYPDVSIQQLLSNTSGIPNIDEILIEFRQANSDTIFTMHDVIPALLESKLPLNFNAGAGWDYSNTNYVLAALLVEKISGEKYGNYLFKNIFKPAGMVATFQRASGENAYTHANVAYNYAWPYISSPAAVRVDSFAIDYYRIQYQTLPAEGDANIYSSVNDLVRFDKALKGGVLLNKKSMNLLFSPATSIKGRIYSFNGVGSEVGEIGNFYWGCGNRILIDSTYGKIVWYSGGMPGCATNIISNLSTDQTLIWLDNRESKSAMNNLFGAFYLINGVPTAALKAKTHVAVAYAQTLEHEGADIAFARLTDMVADTANYILDEDEFNTLGYEYDGRNLRGLAFEVFRSAISLFPESDNLYNSYGELLVKSGKKKEAVIMYKKSLLLNPENEDSQKSLKQLEDN
ncbi:MAG: serine hydrolase [Chitinophagales bacterium]